MAGYVGLSFPLRIGVNGGWVLSKADATETTHLKEAIKLALLTHLGERVMEYMQGSRVMESVFENMDRTLVSVLEFKIQDVLERVEPRIQVMNVTVTFDQVNAEIYANISYRIIDSKLTDLLSVKLTKQY